MQNFTIDCTLPPARTVFVNSPNARGTLDIVWSCIAVIVLCTLSVQHLNVPLQIKPANRKQKYLRTIDRVFTQVKWMVFNILAPEVPFAQALDGVVCERTLEKTFEEWGEADGVDWTKSHTQLANMGGFVVAFGPNTERPAQYAVIENTEEVPCVVGSACIKNRKQSYWWLTYIQPILQSLMEASTKQKTLESGTLNDTLADSKAMDPAGSPPIPAESSTNSLQHNSAPKKDQSSPGSLPQSCAGDDPAHAVGPLHTPKRLIWGVFRGCPHRLPTWYYSGTLDRQLDAVNMKRAKSSYEALRTSIFEEDLEAFQVDVSHWLSNLKPLCTDQWVLSARQLLVAREHGIVAKLPSISEDKIKDVDKSSIFVRCLAIGQIAWFCIQLSVRRAYDIPITQFEVLTLAFAICSIFAFVLTYNRPKDVQTVLVIEAARYPTSDELTSIAHAGPDVYGLFRKDSAIPNNAMHGTRSIHVVFSSVSAIFIFGSLHFIAWDFEYPRPIEKTLWRASVIVTITAIPAMFFRSIIGRLSGLLGLRKLQRALDVKNPVASNWNSLWIWLLWAIFAAARVFILLEALRSLAFQPSDAFRGTWAANIPHGG